MILDRDDEPVFVKEKKIPAKGIISSSVATVPKLICVSQNVITFVAK